MEDRVDQAVHPLPPTIPTSPVEDEATGIHWTTRAALILLAVFVLALPLAGVLGPLLGLSWGLGLLGLAVSTLTASILLGAE